MMNERLLRMTRGLLAAGVFVLALLVFTMNGANAGQLILPESISRIEEEAFFDDTSLDGLVLNDSLTYVGPRAFAGSSLRWVRFPSDPIDIASDAFSDCENLQALVSPGSWAQQWCEDNGVPWLTPPVYSQGSLIVKNGAYLQVGLDSMHSANAHYSWSSGNESILTVDENGQIFGEYPGTATLTVMLPDGSEPVEIQVLVQANYRALLFSESTYNEGNVWRNKGDVLIMKRLLASVTGPDGGTYSVSTFDDLASTVVYQKIADLLATPSREGDVSLFFFASHGDPTSTTRPKAGRLWCKKKESSIHLQILAARLLNIKGKVIVILESCGPGAAMHAWPEGNIFTANPDKFIILAAADYLQFSKQYHEQAGDLTSCNVFPHFIGTGVGTKGAMPADTNSDGILTVKELHTYVYNKTLKHTSYRNSQNLLIEGQKTVMWPQNSTYPLFMRKNP